MAQASKRSYLFGEKAKESQERGSKESTKIAYIVGGDDPFSASLSTAGVWASLTDEKASSGLIKASHWITDSKSSGESCEPRHVSRSASPIM